MDSIYYLGLIGVVLDVVQKSENGILRGLGNLVWPSITALVVFYVFFQPVSISLLFNTHLGLLSIWIVLPFTAVLNGVAYFVMIRREDFEKVAYSKHNAMQQEQRGNRKLLEGK